MSEIKLSLDRNKRYVVAVSGGVDSIVLLDLVALSIEKSQIIVAHFNHKVRSIAESEQDKNIIVEAGEKYGIEVVQGERVNGGVSEAELRTQRYAFLEKVRKDHECDYILTAHHGDDVVETAIINLLRGTKSRGLGALQSHGTILRPLVDYTKQQIVEYAQSRDLVWHEDVTNQDETILRNYIRVNIIPKLEKADKLDEFKKRITDSKVLETESKLLSESLLETIHGYGSDIDRLGFILLPHEVSMRLMRDMIEQFCPSVPLNKKVISKAVVFCKTARDGAHMDISKQSKIAIKSNLIEFLNK